MRVNAPGGPRASAKLVRWARVQVGELGVETQGGHRILSFSVEGVIFLQGVDAEADRIAAFALGLVSAIDGRVTDVDATFGRVIAVRRPPRAGTKGSAKATGAKATAPAKGTPGRGRGAAVTAPPSRAGRSSGRS